MDKICHKEYFQLAQKKYEDGLYLEALCLLNKVEEVSPDGKCPEATFNKGYILLNHFHDYQKALESFSKAEEGSPNCKFPEASYEKGLLFSVIFQDYQKAFDCYSKAEEDSLEGKYPDASYNKGVLFEKHFQDYPKAFDCYTKAEEDSLEGKYPNASFNKGNLLSNNFQDNPKAFDCYTKAEEDSLDGKFPKASFNKGFLLAEIFQDHQKAINSFSKAINDNVFFDNVQKLSYIGKSRSYLKLSDYTEAKKNVYIVLNEDSRYEIAIDHLIKYFTTLHTRIVYENRLEYLAIYLGIKSQQAKELNSDFGAHTYLRESKIKDVNEFLFLCLDERIKFDSSISENDKLRLAYLVAFKNKLYANVFYIIDSLIDDKYELTDCDMFFYCASAYLIGEPKNELKYFINLNPINKNSQFGRAFLYLRNDIKEAIKINRNLDEYLLDVNPVEFMPKSYSIQEEMHPWVNDCLNSIISNTNYKIPISKNVVEGLFTRLITEISNNVLDSCEFEDNSQWEIFEALLEKGKYNATLLDTICKSIDEGIPYLKIMYVFFEEYNKSSDENNLHNIAVLQAATSTYGKAKKVLGQGGVLNSSKTILSFFAELGINESFGILGFLGLLPKLGVTLTCAIITSSFIDVIKDKVSLKNQMDKYKAELI